MVDEKKILKILEDQKKQLDRIEKLLTKKTGTLQVEQPKSRITKTKKLTITTMLMLFKEEKFFDQPKTLGEIVKKFSEESRIVKPTGLTLPLQRLVRNRGLSRIMKNKRWAYVKR